MTDVEARKVIIEELNKNIFVVAGAGSGKTFMLVNRIVALVESGVDIGEICAITFTVNAAAEFLERLTALLKRRASGESAKEDYLDGGLGPIKHPELDKKALENIDMCFAGTIDSFSNLILSEYPLDAGIPSSSSIIDEVEEERRYKEEFSNIAHNDPTNIAFKNFTRLFKNPSDTFSKSIKSVVDAIMLDIEYVKPSKNIDEYVNYFKAKYEAKFKHDIDTISNSESLLASNEKAINNYEAFKAKKYNVLASWNINEILEASKLASKIKNLSVIDDPNIKECALFDLASPRAKNYTYQAGCLLDEFINDVNRMKHSIALEFLLYAANQVREKLKKEGKLTFTEYLYTFRNMVMKDLVNPSMPIITHIRKRFTHFLIDESQDTSPFQYDLFMCLCAMKSAPSIKDISLIPGSLFIVGDPKQSIYRFRGADISSYKNVEKVFNGGNNIVVELYNNFRSSKLVCSYFNDILKDMKDYTPIGNVNDAKVKDPNDGQGIYTCASYVDVIKTMVDNPKYALNDKKGNKRNLSYGDFMIIANNKENLYPIGEALSSNNIPYYSEGYNYVASRKIVEVVFAIYAYLVDPNYPGYLYNLYASPLFNFSIKELMCLKDIKLDEEQAELFLQIESLKDISNPVLLFSKIYEDIPLFHYIDMIGIDYIYYLKNALEKAYSENLVASKLDALNFLKERMTAPLERTAQLERKPNAVYIANTHKVKGLEASVVILDKAGVSTKSPIKSLDYIAHKAYLFKLSENKYEGGGSSFDVDASSLYKDAEELEKIQSKEEKERLRYVAATRARNYLFINPGDRGGGAWKELLTDKYFSEFIVDDDQLVKFDSNKSPLDIKDIYLDESTPISFNEEETYKIVLPSKLKLNYEHNLEEASEESIDTDAALKGTLVHALLEHYVNSGLSIDTDELVSLILNKYNVDDSYRDMLVKVMDTMKSGGYIQASGEKLDLFSILREAEEVYCELPFAYKRKEYVFNGTIDLLYKYKGNYYIVDYKTNLDGSSLDEKYEKQLNAYVLALKITKNIEAKASIYHIEL